MSSSIELSNLGIYYIPKREWVDNQPRLFNETFTTVDKSDDKDRENYANKYERLGSDGFNMLYKLLLPLKSYLVSYYSDNEYEFKTVNSLHVNISGDKIRKTIEDKYILVVKQILSTYVSIFNTYNKENVHEYSYNRLTVAFKDDKRLSKSRCETNRVIKNLTPLFIRNHKSCDNMCERIGLNPILTLLISLELYKNSTDNGTELNTVVENKSDVLEYAQDAISSVKMPKLEKDKTYKAIKNIYDRVLNLLGYYHMIDKKNISIDEMQMNLIEVLFDITDYNKFYDNMNKITDYAICDILGITYLLQNPIKIVAKPQTTGRVTLVGSLQNATRETKKQIFTDILGYRNYDIKSSQINMMRYITQDMISEIDPREFEYKGYDRVNKKPIYKMHELKPERYVTKHMKELKNKLYYMDNTIKQYLRYFDNSGVASILNISKDEWKKILYPTLFGSNIDYDESTSRKYIEKYIKSIKVKNVDLIDYYGETVSVKIPLCDSKYFKIFLDIAKHEHGCGKFTLRNTEYIKNNRENRDIIINMLNTYFPILKLGKLFKDIIYDYHELCVNRLKYKYKNTRDSDLIDYPNYVSKNPIDKYIVEVNEERLLDEITYGFKTHKSLNEYISDCAKVAKKSAEVKEFYDEYVSKGAKGIERYLKEIHKEYGEDFKLAKNIKDLTGKERSSFGGKLLSYYLQGYESRYIYSLIEVLKAHNKLVGYEYFKVASIEHDGLVVNNKIPNKLITIAKRISGINVGTLKLVEKSFI